MTDTIPNAGNLGTTAYERLHAEIARAEDIIKRGDFATKTDIANVNSSLKEKASKTDVQAANARMDSFVAVGSTADNAETTDIRVGADGVTYRSAGTAVRAQFQNALETINNYIFDGVDIKITKEKLAQGSYSAREIQVHTGAICSKELYPVKKGDTIKYNTNGLYFACGVYVGDATTSSGWTGWKTGTGEITIAYDGLLFVQFAKNNTTSEHIEVDDYVSDVSIYNGHFTRELKATNERIETFEKEVKTLTYDVCIVGGGASGVSCAYALKNSGLKVCLLEKQPYLGGIHTQGYVNALQVSPSPKFLEDVIRSEIAKGQACFSIGEHTPVSKEDSNNIEFKQTYVRGTKQSYHIIINPRSMAMKYYEDLSSRIDIMLNTYITECDSKDNVIYNVTTNKGNIIKAKQFIDCTGDNILLELAGCEMYLGGDSSTRYQEEYGFTEQHAPENNYAWCNAPTLMYRVAKGEEDLSKISATFTNFCAYVYSSNDPQRIYINSFNGVNDKAGEEIITQGIDYVYNNLAPNMIRHWKTVKNGYLANQMATIGDYKFENVAPILGVREYKRAKCERMLHEEQLYVMATPENIKSPSNNLDKMIAIGNAGIDIYGDPYITSTVATEMNALVKPFGVPYGCLIPKGLKNVLVASRGSGMTHIAQSSFRITKQMMQLGWVAGHATRLLNENELNDYRSVNVETLQTDEYAGVTTLVNDVLSCFQ